MTRQEFMKHWVDRLRNDPAVRSRCFYCGVLFTDVGWEAMRTRDHIIPKSKMSGAHFNLIESCAWCNTRKGSRWVREFREKRIKHGPITKLPFFGEEVLGFPMPGDMSKYGNEDRILFFDDLIEETVRNIRSSVNRRFHHNPRLKKKLDTITSGCLSQETHC